MLNTMTLRKESQRLQRKKHCESCRVNHYNDRCTKLSPPSMWWWWALLLLNWIITSITQLLFIYDKIKIKSPLHNARSFHYTFQPSFFPHDTNVVTLTKCNVMVLQHNNSITFICNVIYMLLKCNSKEYHGITIIALPWETWQYHSNRFEGDYKCWQKQTIPYILKKWQKI